MDSTHVQAPGEVLVLRLGQIPGVDGIDDGAGVLAQRDSST